MKTSLQPITHHRLGVLPPQREIALRLSQTMRDIDVAWLFGVTPHTLRNWRGHKKPGRPVQDRLRALAISREYGPKRAAEMTGVSVQTIWRWEKRAESERREAMERRMRAA